MLCSLQADTKSRGSSFCRKDRLELQNEDPRLNAFSLQADTKSRGSSFVEKTGSNYKTKTPLISHHLVSEEKRRSGLTVSGLIGL